MIYCLDSAWYELPMANEGRICTPAVNNSNCCFKNIQFGNVKCTLVRENNILFVGVVREKGLFSEEKVRESQGKKFLTTCINPVLECCFAL